MGRFWILPPLPLHRSLGLDNASRFYIPSKAIALGLAGTDCCWAITSAASQSCNRLLWKLSSKRIEDFWISLQIDPFNSKPPLQCNLERAICFQLGAGDPCIPCACAAAPKHVPINVSRRNVDSEIRQGGVQRLCTCYAAFNFLCIRPDLLAYGICLHEQRAMHSCKAGFEGVLPAHGQYW